MKNSCFFRGICRSLILLGLCSATVCSNFLSLTAKTCISYVSKVDQSIEQSNDNSKPEIADWTFYIYMQARNNLAPYASKNIDAISSAKTGEKVNFVVQLDEPKRAGAWRYEIKENQTILANYSDIKNPLDQTEKIIDFVRWGAKAYPSKHHCLIFWNHGVGVLDPLFYGSSVKSFLGQNYDYLCSNSAQEDEFADCDSEDESNSFDAQTDLVLPAIQRGVMFDEENHTFMTSRDLSRALEKITSAEILNKKIECLGFDACYMAGLEIDSQISNYAEYRISSQELELAHGWAYHEITKALCTSTSYYSPNKLAKLVVTSFGNMYRGKTNLYTQSAVKLSCANEITNQLNKIIDAIEVVTKLDKNFILEATKQARKNCQQFTAKVYIDLASFYQQFMVQIENRLIKADPSTLQRIRQRQIPVIGSKLQAALHELHNALADGIAGINSAVIENSRSSYLANARGISIYFPFRAIDASYYACSFAQSSRWLEFISAFAVP